MKRPTFPTGKELVEASDEQRLDEFVVFQDSFFSKFIEEDKLTVNYCEADNSILSLRQFGIKPRLIATFGGLRKESWSNQLVIESAL